MIGVHTGPGATQLARSPYCTTSWAKPSVNGLGAMQQLARERKTAEAAVGKA